MNIYLIACPSADYDEYQAWVVMDTSPEAAFEQVRASGDREDEYDPYDLLPKVISNGAMDQVDIELLGYASDTTPRIVYSDFNAG